MVRGPGPKNSGWPVWHKTGKESRKMYRSSLYTDVKYNVQNFDVFSNTEIEFQDLHKILFGWLFSFGFIVWYFGIFGIFILFWWLFVCLFVCFGYSIKEMELTQHPSYWSVLLRGDSVPT